MGGDERASRNPGEPIPELAVGSAFGRYQIVRCVGVGGMGSVYEARHVLLKKRVALKTLHQSLLRSEAAQARFLREAETLARVRHPNVIDITDLGIEAGIPYLVMEYLEGEDLAGLLDREGKVSAERAVDLLLPIVAGLCAVHRLGIVHRDIKPENIVLAREGAGQVVPKLIDFGVSKELHDVLVQRPNTVTGTPQYMAPEQASGSVTLDGRADQYSIGVTLYQLLSGRLPYESPSLLELIHLIDCGEHPPLRHFSSEIPVALEEIVHRAMARHAIDRFPSAAELGLALLPFASERTRQLYGESFHLQPEDSSEAARDRQRRASAPTTPAVDLLRGIATVRHPPTASGVRLRESETEAERTGTAHDARLRWLAVGCAIGALILVALWLALGKRAVISVEASPLDKPVPVKVSPDSTVRAAQVEPTLTPVPAAAPAEPTPFPGAAQGAPPARATPTERKPRAHRASQPERPSDIQLSR